jgi:hypothetical protein
MYSIQPTRPDDIRPPIPEHPVRLLDLLRRHMRDRGYAWKTEKTYIHWIRRFLRFHGLRHPDSLSAVHVEQYLSHLANERHCSPATQRIVLNSLVYLFTKFLGIELEGLDYNKATPHRRLPVVLTHPEVLQILEHLGDKPLHRTPLPVLLQLPARGIAPGGTRRPGRGQRLCRAGDYRRVLAVRGRQSPRRRQGTRFTPDHRQRVHPHRGHPPGRPGALPRRLCGAVRPDQPRAPAQPQGRVPAQTEQGCRAALALGRHAGPKVRGQIEHELKLIAELGYAPFFLTVLRHRPLRPRQGHPLPGPRLGGQLGGLLLPWHHRGGPGADGDAVRALRLARARRAAGHRRGLRAPAPRGGDPVHLRKYGRDRAALAATVISYRPKSAGARRRQGAGLVAGSVDRLARNINWWDGQSVPPERLREVGLDPFNPRCILQGLMRWCMS